ncbi:MAG: peptidoglycan editing factor PgeF [Clostridiales bacterium]|nr:peptidoglycan editing factor PgeF [Clostridiales bacterium]
MGDSLQMKEQQKTEWIRKPAADERLKLHDQNGVSYFTFPALDQTGLVRHAFSTRLGGVSQGQFATMNFSFTRGDDPERVRENYRRMADVLGVSEEKMVLSHQTHTTNVRVIHEEDVGKGITRERDYQDVDGLVTDLTGVTLVTFFADCVPLYLLDPVHRAIGLSHSGWRGTVHRMGKGTLEVMRREYGTRAEDVIAAIGPSICQDCYEVGEDVAREFSETFAPDDQKRIFYQKKDGKYQLNLWEANRIVFQEAGVLPQHIHVTDICTHCNPQWMFSHRAQGEKRGNLAAFLCLK